jgi:RNA polymerase sigma factor (sigma-70 family)
MPTGQFCNVVNYARRLAQSGSRSEASDRDLLARFVKDRDQDAFGALVDRHGSMVLGVCRRVLGNEHDAQDAFQGVFLVLAKKANQVRWRDSIGNWLHGVAHRLALQVRDTLARQRAGERQLLQTAKSGDHRNDSSVRELCATLDEELRKLPDRYRAALICCYLKGQTRDQAALECGWSLRTLDRRLHKGRELLKLRLLRRGVSLSAVLLVSELATRGSQAGVTAALSSSTVRAALGAGTSVETIQGISSVTVAVAKRMSGPLAVVQMKHMIAVGLVAGVIAISAGAIAMRFGSANEPESDSHPEALPAQKSNEPIRSANLLNAPGRESLPDGAVVRLGSDRLKPLGNMMHMAFSPDGSKLASWSDESGVNNALCIWESATGNLLKRVDLLGARIDTLEWLPNGKGISLIDTGHAERGLLVWEFTSNGPVPVIALGRATGLPIFIPPPPPPADRCFAISPDGKTLAVGRSTATGAGGLIEFRELKSGSGTAELPTRKRFANELGNCELIRFTSDGTRLVVLETAKKAANPLAERTQVVVVWDVASGKEISRFTTPAPTEFLANRPPVAVADRELAIGLEDGGTIVWDLARGKSRRIETAHAGQKPGQQVGTQAIAFSSDGKSLATGGNDGLVKVWETSTGKLLRIMPRIFAGVESLAIAPDNRTIAAGYDGFLRLWDSQSGSDKCPQPGHEYSVRQAVLSLDGKTSVTSGWDRSLRWWNTGSGREVRRIGLPETAEALALSPDGRTVVAGLEPNTLRTWNLSDGKELKSTELPGEIKRGGLLFTPDGNRLLVVSGKQVHLLSWPGLGLLGTIELPKPVKQPGEPDCEQVTISQDGRWLVTVACRSHIRKERGFLFEGQDDGIVDLWDLSTGKPVRTLAKGTSVARSAHFTSDGHLLLTNNLNYMIPAQAGRPAQAFSGNIALLDVIAPRWIRSFEASGKRGETILRISGIAQLSPDSRTLYVGYNTGEICAFEVATGQIRRVLHGHRGDVYSLSFQANGKKMISGGRDGNALIWNISLSSMAEPLKQPASDAVAEQLWSQAGLDDARAAYQALANLTSMPEQVVKLLRSQIEPLRESVDAEEKPSVRARQIRALELLEGIGTPAARALLEELAKGEATSPVAADARATLARLRK